MSNESAYVLNTKINNDIFTIRGDNAEQFIRNCQDFLNLQLADHVLGVQEAITEATNGTNTAARVLNATVVEQPAAPVAPPVQPQLQQTYGKDECKHGKRNYREGTTKDGRQFRVWNCPVNFKDPTACKPNFL